MYINTEYTLGDVIFYKATTADGRPCVCIGKLGSLRIVDTGVGPEFTYRLADRAYSLREEDILGKTYGAYVSSSIRGFLGTEWDTAHPKPEEGTDESE